MATFALTDATTWVAGYDFTTDLNQITLNVSAEDLDNTTFGLGGYRRRVAGLKSVESSYTGFWDALTTTTGPDPNAFPDLGTINQVVTMSNDDAEASTAYMFQAGKFSYTPFGDIGEVTPFELSMMGTNSVGVVRGQVAKAKGNVTATGATGSGVNLGNVGSTQFLYATLHVFSVGTTITVTVESDDNAGFTTPTTRITFGPITTTGGTWGTRVAGPLTETHYRFNVTAITGTFSIAGAIAIGS